MKGTWNTLAVALLLTATAQLSAQVGGSMQDQQGSKDYPGDRLVCPANAVHDTGNLPKFANTSVNDGIVFLNDRVSPTGVVFYAPPEHKIFILTDIVVQNRAPGDEPVSTTQFSRTDITAPTGADVTFSVVGNDTLSQHFHTGILEPTLFRFYNLANSSAPYVEVHITGVLRDCKTRRDQ